MTAVLPLLRPASSRFSCIAWRRSSILSKAASIVPYKSTRNSSPPQYSRYFSISSSQLEKSASASSSSSSSSSLESTPSKSSNSSLTSAESENVSPFSYDTQEPHYDPAEYHSLPQTFGANQYMHINEELRQNLRQLLWQFRAPIRYAIAYGSGVFSQGTASSGGKKPMIDLIFGVTYTQHWHSLNLAEHPDHYSFLGSLGSAVVGRVQDDIGAGVYFNPYVEVNGMMIKYGVVNLDTFCRDLTDWDTLYLAGRMHKPVKILRDDARVRLSNQANLLSAIRVALLLLPEKFTEEQLYHAICGISYMGDPRMNLFTENPHKVANIVANQLPNFRRLYSPLVDTLPNLVFKDDPQKDIPKNTMLIQDMDPKRRGNMVRRLPKTFRKQLYFQYQKKWQMPRLEYEKLTQSTEDQERVEGRRGGVFEQRIANDLQGIRKEVQTVIKGTISWPSTTQSLKGLLTGGATKSWRYLAEKVKKWRTAKKSS